MSVEIETEILADQPEDISGRLITTENLKRFKGLPAQVVFNKDEDYRPYVMDGENFGGKPLMFTEDNYIPNGTFNYLGILVNAPAPEITLDTDITNHFKLDLQVPTTRLEFADFSRPETDVCRKTTIYLKFTTGNNHVFFPDNFFWEDSIGSQQLDVAQKLSQNKPGDLAVFECFTLDSGFLWFGKMIGYWSK